MTDRVLTAEQAAELLQLPISTVSQLCRQGRIPGAQKLGRQWRINESDVLGLFSEYLRPLDPPAFPGVYFIQAGTAGPIKIGVASNIAKRFAQNQTGNHVECHLVGFLENADRATEQRFHLRSAEARLRGEWFRPVPALVAFVMSLV
jgi:excisionase family DNA binding protein